MENKIDITFIQDMNEEPDNCSLLTNTNYVRKSLLKYYKGKVYGNWSPNRKQVCIAIDTRYYILENDIVSIESAGICETHNDEILMFTHH
ncbi:hypothetical protein CHU92_02695 [Flavobacterium cyanobacteriorum]|uniref:Uncharacterized protein n=1 Tax=Flavobacterium cyanobacteriorum TaxID=2022802 RepID=A0A255ZR44_9FLAO|nr:hypothetical protein [Flavobacterium cyanobacteriorum]OYQ43968.1 hypothetical protein CHU92_02695 [Flavobacterium cyanobacteriorum]